MRNNNTILNRQRSDQNGKVMMVLILLSLITISCKKNGLFVSAGAIKTISVATGSFTEIEVNDKINLVLTYDSVTAVSVEAGENLLSDIETNVQNGKLVLHDNNKFKWSRDLGYKITVYVHGNLFNRITYQGAGNVSSTNTLKTKQFYVDSNTGVGSINLDLECDYTELFIRIANADFRITGNSTTTRIYCADYGSMDLSGFISDQVYMDYRSVRNSTINATTLLSAKILYKGNVYYYGKPVVDVSFASSGRLIALP